MCDNDRVGYDGTVLNVDWTPLSMDHMKEFSLTLM